MCSWLLVVVAAARGSLEEAVARGDIDRSLGDR
jgi:hypothetical protein